MKFPPNFYLHLPTVLWFLPREFITYTFKSNFIGRDWCESLSVPKFQTETGNFNTSKNYYSFQIKNQASTRKINVVDMLLQLYTFLVTHLFSWNKKCVRWSSIFRSCWALRNIHLYFHTMKYFDKNKSKLN